jgi:uncharacterized protein YjiS (DUF1127 family)
MSSITASSCGASRAAFTAPEDAASALARGISRSIAWIRRRREMRRAIDALADLDDHLLADLGLSRDRIKKAARTGHLPGYPAH